MENENKNTSSKNERISKEEAIEKIKLVYVLDEAIHLVQRLIRGAWQASKLWILKWKRFNQFLTIGSP